jgi:uncharacterized damage-inducible protein DinB
MTERAISGRPAAGEYAAYAHADIDLVAGDDIVRALVEQIEQTLSVLQPVPDARAATLTYAPGKWTLKQVVGHMSDDERIFAYRALCLARNEAQPLPGFEEKDYVRFGHFEDRTFSDLLEELRIVRQSTLALFRGLHPEAWLRRGVVNGYGATTRGLAFHLAGHELHHMAIVREKYLRA